MTKKQNLEEIRATLRRFHEAACQAATEADDPITRACAESDASAIRIVLAYWDEIVTDARPHGGVRKTV